jgi:histidinol-phosphate aminotransferase
MSRFLSERFAALTPYVPGEQPTDMKYIKLNTNESPYPPSPKVTARLNASELGALRLYPDPTENALRQKVSKSYGVAPENIFFANGSDESLAFIFMAFYDAEKPVDFPDITYGFYPVYCALFGIPYETIPLREDFTVRCADYCGLGKNIVLANPNAPTGLAVAPEEIEEILRSNPDNLVVIDEAYVDFGARSSVGLIKKYDNLLVVHTCSKSRSLAGARLSFVFGPEELIADIEKIRYSFNSYNVTRPTLSAGEAALDDQPYYDDMQKKIMDTREKTASALKTLGFELTDSRANFLFARYPGRSGGELYQKLRDMGILVRHFDKPRISDYLRITVGTPEQMDTLIAALNTILNKGE